MILEMFTQTLKTGLARRGGTLQARASPGSARAIAYAWATYMCWEIDMFLPRLCLTATLVLTGSWLTGCATAPAPQLQGAKFETQDLRDALGDRRVAITGKYKATWSGSERRTYTEQDYADDGRTDYCKKIRDVKLLETSIGSWAPRQVAWAQRSSEDVQFVYSWNCEHFYTDGGGGSAALALFTLGAAPVKEDARLTLDIDLYTRGKKIFTKKYTLTTSAMVNMWANKNGEVSQQNFATSAGVLIERFSKDLSRDGALEP